MRKSKLAISAIFALVFSLLQPVLPATSVDTVDKTFTITKSDGSVYPNASVALFGYSETLKRNFISDVATSDSLGLATVTVNVADDYYGYSVQPPAGDYSHATFSEFSMADGQAQHFNVQLRVANLVVELLQTNGQTAPVGSWVHYPGSQFSSTSFNDAQPVLRLGPIGLDITTLAEGTEYALEAEPNGLSNQKWSRYFIKKSGNTFAISRDRAGTDLVAPAQGSSIYPLRFASPNLSGRLVDSQNAHLPIPAGVAGTVEIFHANLSGLPSNESAASATDIEADGSFSLNIFEPVAGKYFPVFRVSGSLSIPTFIGEPFWIDSTGKYSRSESGTFNAALDLVEQVPASNRINLKIENIDSSSQSPLEAYNWAVAQGSGKLSFWGPGNAKTTISSYVLIDGNYRLTVDPGPVSTSVRKTYLVTVSGGVATVTTESGDAVAPSAGVFNLATELPNFDFEIINPSNSQTYLESALVEIFDPRIQNGNPYLANFWTEDGSGRLQIPTGSYDLLVNPFSGTFATSRYHVVNNAGSITLTSPSGETILPNSDGKYELLPAAANIKGRVLQPNGQQFNLGENAQLNIATQKLNLDGNWDYVDELVSLSASGAFAINIQTEGVYRLKIEPHGVDSAAGVNTTIFEVTQANRGSLIKDFGEIRLAVPTAKFKVRLPGSNENVTNSNIEVLLDGVWVDWLQTGNSTGIATFAATTTGSYTFIAHPSLDSAGGTRKSYSATYSLNAQGQPTFLVDGAPVDQDGVFTLELATANVTGQILKSNGNPINTNIGEWVDIQLQKFNTSTAEWDWANQFADLKTDGNFSMSIEDQGTFRLRFEPYGIGGQALAISEEFVLSDDVTSKNFGPVRLSSPTVTGTVVDPNGTPIANSQIAAVDSQTGRELYEYSAQTDNDGHWSMVLPAGRYRIFAKAPWDNPIYGLSNYTSEIVVGSNGAVTSGPVTPIQLALTLPTWSGKVVNPDNQSQVLAHADVCLHHEEANRNTHQCSVTDSQGNWSLSAPDWFTNFNENSQLSVSAEPSAGFATADFRGLQEIEGVLGDYVDDGRRYTNIPLSPSTANAIITVTAPDSNGQENAVANIWVNIERDDSGWLGGGMTNSSGQVRLNIPNLSQGFSVRAEVNNNSQIAELFAGIRKNFSASQAVAGTNSQGIFGATISLEAPNFRAIVESPVTPNGPVQNAWVEAFDESDSKWLGGSNSLANGNVALKLTHTGAGSTLYKVSVRPPWNGSDDFAVNTYFVEVNAVGVLAVHLGSENGPVINAVSGRYHLTLALPSITGRVTDPTTQHLPVRDSYVNVVKNYLGFDEWFEGDHTNSNGEFAISVGDGRYELFANPPGRTTTYAKSPRCTVIVSSGSINPSESGSCASSGSVQLQLSEPNLKFKLVNATGAAVSGAHVHISIGMWNTWAQSSTDGTVALNVDSSEVQANNPGRTGSIPVRVTVDPPYGNSDLVRWDCNSNEVKPICEDLSDFVVGQTYLSSLLNLGDVTFQAPNTSLSVLLPNGTLAGIGAWVSLFVDENGWRRWIGGSNTSANGVATFNVDAQYNGSRFSVEVNAPWGQRQDYSQKLYSNLTLNQVKNQSFELGSPNLNLTINQAAQPGSQATVASKWSWVGVEEVNATTFQHITWLSGFGADDKGRVALTLPAGKTVKLTLNPGPGSTGARTSCVFTVGQNGTTISKVASQCVGQASATVAAGAITLELSAGNFVGQVSKGASSTGLEGAIVFAQAYSFAGAIVTSKTEQTVTNASGRYGLELDPAYNWQVKVYYVTPEGALVGYRSMQNPQLVSGTSLTLPQEFNVGLQEISQ